MKKRILIALVGFLVIGGGAAWATPHWFNLKGIQADIHHEYDQKVDKWAKDHAQDNPYPLKQFKQEQAHRMHEEIEAYYKQKLKEIESGQGYADEKKDIKKKADQLIQELKDFIDQKFKEHGYES